MAIKPVQWNDYYATLGIPKGATDDEIRKAFRDKANEVHPDKGNQEDLKDLENRKNRFQEINEAKEVLLDKKLRDEYNRYQENRDYEAKLRRQRDEARAEGEKMRQKNEPTQDTGGAWRNAEDQFNRGNDAYEETRREARAYAAAQARMRDKGRSTSINSDGYFTKDYGDAFSLSPNAAELIARMSQRFKTQAGPEGRSTKSRLETAREFRRQFETEYGNPNQKVESGDNMARRLYEAMLIVSRANQGRESSFRRVDEGQLKRNLEIVDLLVKLFEIRKEYKQESLAEIREFDSDLGNEGKEPPEGYNPGTRI